MHVFGAIAFQNIRDTFLMRFITRPNPEEKTAPIKMLHETIRPAAVDESGEHRSYRSACRAGCGRRRNRSSNGAARSHYRADRRHGPDIYQ